MTKSHSAGKATDDFAKESSVEGVPPTVARVLRAPGKPLEPTVRSFMEERFGQDFGAVRVHTDATAADSASDVAAKAYTVGNDVVFQRGEYAPDTTAGRRSIAHELAHVVQQGRGTGRTSGLDSHHPHEDSANQAAAQAMAGSAAPVQVSGAAGPGLARIPDEDKRQKQLYLSEASGYDREATATRTGRGFTPRIRRYFKNLERMYGGPSRFDITHRTTPFGLLRAGESTMVGLEERTANRSRGASERAQVADAKAAGKFARTGNVDMTAPAIKGPKPPAAPVSPEIAKVENWKPPAPKAAATPQATPPPAAAATGLSSQMDLPFDKPPATTTPAQAPPPAKTPPAAAAAEPPRLRVAGSELRIGANGQLVTVAEAEVEAARQAAAARALAEAEEAAVQEAEEALAPKLRMRMGGGPSSGGSAPAAPGAPSAAPRPAPVGGGGAAPSAPLSELPAPGSGVRVRIGGVAAASTPAPAVAAKPVPTTVPQPAPGPLPKAAPTAAPKTAGLTAARGGRVAGLAGSVGPTVLTALNNYLMAREDAKKLPGRIDDAVAANESQAKAQDLIEKRHLDIARKQHRGATVYVTVRIKIVTTNGILDRLFVSDPVLTDTDQSESTAPLAMSHDGLTGAETAYGSLTTSTPLTQVETLASERIGFQLEDLDNAAAADGSPEHQARRTQLQTERQAALREEEQARQAELARPAVIADPRKRAKQQAQITDRLRELNKAEPAPKAVQQPAPAGPPSLTLAPAPVATPSFLPGASRPGPIEEAAAAVEQLRAWTNRMNATAGALDSRLGSGHSPTVEERQAFAKALENWQLGMKFWMNKLKAAGREEAVNALGELLDRHGAKLAGTRGRLGE